MEHRAYTRRTDHRKTAVLMVHGIAGTPAHFAFLMPAVDERFSINNILLDGHGGTVDDFSRTSMKKWKAQVKAMLDDLFDRYERVFIVAHSMGTLFALQAAVDHPDRIAGLFLLSPPMRPRVKLSAMLTAVRVALGWYSPADARAAAMYGDTSIRLTRKLWKYIGWTPRMIELVLECRRVRKILPEMKVPAKAFHAKCDELVSMRSMKDLAGHPYIENAVLETSGHFACSAEDGAALRGVLSGMLEKM